MYSLKYTSRFEHDVNACKKKGLDLEILWQLVDVLVETGSVPPECNPHMLSEEYAGCWECHIDNDWLLVWRQNDKHLTLLLTNTGTHKELFGSDEE